MSICERDCQIEFGVIVIATLCGRCIICHETELIDMTNYTLHQLLAKLAANNVVGICSIVARVFRLDDEVFY